MAVNEHAQALFSQSHASHGHASPGQLPQSQAAVLACGLAQHEVATGDLTGSDFAELVAQPQDSHKQDSQVQTPVQFGHRQSTHPQPEAFAVSRFEFAKPKAPAHASVAAAKTAGMEKVFMVLLSMRMVRKQNESSNVSVRFVQFSHLQRRAKSEGP